MTRRFLVLLTLICGLGLSAVPLLAQAELLRASFSALAPDQARRVQTELQGAGLYEGAIDGRYGPRTEASLVAGAAFLAENSEGAVIIDLTSPEGVAAYLRALHEGKLAAWLYGEGGECDGC
ncbi:MAG: hypothetical protein AUK60_00570 [Rhodobacteraceae bacterium CG2_30_10_405]|nr:hypothetical protein [Rhodobacterales bacterium]OIQ07451.1 MAG: hypothetical protein AUK60_00570 [Rhodobacteraceae bacterium CG2_30_10_405]